MTPHLRRAGNVLTIGTVVAILVATLLPEDGQSMATHLCVICGPMGGVDAILNVLLFIPLGAGLAMSGVQWRRAVWTGCLLSIAVETTQLLFISGRDATLGDVITNTVGAALGIALVRTARTWLRPQPRGAMSLGLAWGALWLVIQTISAFAFTSSVPGSALYGEIAPTLEGFDLFRGHVISAKVGTLAINDALISDPSGLRQRLLRGENVMASVVPADPIDGIAPILRLADAEQREIVLLAQHDRELLFEVYMGASALRLRSPLFGLADVFPSRTLAEGGHSADTVTLSGRYGTGEAAMNAATPNGNRQHLIPLRTSLGWTLVLPDQWSIEGSMMERVISVAWMMLLVLPLGYWAPFAIRRGNGGSRAWHTAFVLGAVAIFLLAALEIIPTAFGVSPASAHDLLSTVAGLLVGAALTRIPQPNSSDNATTTR